MCFQSPRKALMKTRAKINDLPVELKFNICSRLTVKHLCRLKCVSTEWNHLISDPDFVEQHLEISKRNPRILILNQELELEEKKRLRKPQTLQAFSMDMDENTDYKLSVTFKGYMNMMPSGHCLVCCGNTKNLYIFNPSTSTVNHLPRPAHTLKKDLVAGFGYCPSKDEYILVNLFMQNSDEYEDEMECQVLTLSNVGQDVSPWRVLKDRCPFVLEGVGAYADNAFFWMISEDCYHEEYELIMSFDVEEEKFALIPHPHVMSYIEDNVMKLVALNGQLCLIDTFAYPCIADIWILRDYKNLVWEKKYTMDLWNLVGFDDELTIISPFGFHNGEIILMSEQNELDYYDVEKREFRKGTDLKLKKNSQACLYVDVFPPTRARN